MPMYQVLLRMLAGVLMNVVVKNSRAKMNRYTYIDKFYRPSISYEEYLLNYRGKAFRRKGDLSRRKLSLVYRTDHYAMIDLERNSIESIINYKKNYGHTDKYDTLDKFQDHFEIVYE